MKTVNLSTEPHYDSQGFSITTAKGTLYLESGCYPHGQRFHPLENQITQMENQALGYHAIEYDGYVNLFNEQERLIGGLQLQRRWQMAKLFALWLDEDYRGTGLGGTLMQHAESLSWRLGAKQILLETSSIHHYAFYLAQGFTVLSALDNIIPGETFYIMNKCIGELEC